MNQQEKAPARALNTEPRDNQEQQKDDIKGMETQVHLPRQEDASYSKQTIRESNDSLKNPNEYHGESSPHVTIRTMMAQRAFDVDNEPPKPTAILKLGDKVICTPGNLANVQALPKIGKSHVLVAMIAGMWNRRYDGVDTLGFSADNMEGKAVIHIDTEQSRSDHYKLIRCAMKRIGGETPPPWFYSYCLTDFSIPDRMEAIKTAMKDAVNKHGGVFAVLIDGVADLCASPNDEAESFRLINSLQISAIKYDCSIITVLHENPGYGSSEAKMRGHLGSQLERKAETLLRLSRDAKGITTIWSERCRHNHIPKNEGMCFAWSDDAGMHVSVGKASEINATADRDRMEDEANKVFGSTDSMRHTELTNAVIEALHIKERAAKNRIQKWLTKGVVRKDLTGNYLLSED